MADDPSATSAASQFDRDTPDEPLDLTDVIERSDPQVVRRDQCNGRTLACVNCNRLLGDAHHILCYAYAIARQEADRAR